MPWEDLMVEAYILVQTEVGKAADVASLIAKISGVTQAEDVTGPYDVIVRAQAAHVDELGRLVAAPGASPRTSGPPAALPGRSPAPWCTRAQSRRERRAVRAQPESDRAAQVRRS